MKLDQDFLNIVQNTTTRFNTYDTKIESPKVKRIINPGQVMNSLRHKGINPSELFSEDLFERILGTNDLLPANYFIKGSLVSRSIVRITLFDEHGRELGYGTGFLVGENLLLTNNHVLPNSESANKAIIEFDFETDIEGIPKNSITFQLDPSKLFITSKELDFSLVGTKSTSLNGSHKISDFGFVRLIESTGKINIGSSVSIIQHPNGKRKSVALRNNVIIKILENHLHYQTDTDRGSSGSPVFNDNWEVVALHHSGVARTDENGRILTKSNTIATQYTEESEIDWIANEGVRITRIISFIKENSNAEQKRILNDFFNGLNNSKPEIVNPTHITNIEYVYYDSLVDENQKLKYYEGINVDRDENVIELLSSLIRKTHVHTLTYSPSKYLYPEVDLREEGNLASIYSGKRFTAEELFILDKKVDLDRQGELLKLTQNENLNLDINELQREIDNLEERFPYNCEHVVPQSWFGKRNPMRGDLHHLFTCESNCNSFRSNYPYHDFLDYTPVEEEEKIRQGCGKAENGKFEPNANQGVVARAALYYILRYPKSLNNPDNINVETLLTWHLNNPPTAYEQRRNLKIQMLQGNRNPFIDFPNLTKEDEIINLL